MYVYINIYIYIYIYTYIHIYIYIYIHWESVCGPVQQGNVGECQRLSAVYLRE